MRIYILNIILFLLFFSCQDATAVRENPLDEDGGDYMSPIINLTDIVDGDTLFTETIQINLSGNELVSEYRYKIDSYDWIDWNEEGSITLNYLDEGNHDLSVQSRYLTGDTSEIARVSFVVNAVKGPALLFYPRRHLAEQGEIKTFQIMAEEVVNLMLGEIHIDYNTEDIDVISVSQGNFFQNNQNSLFIYDLNSDSGKIIINTSILDGNVPFVNGSGSLVDIEVNLKESTQSLLTLSSECVLIDSNNNQIIIENKINGIIRNEN